MICVFEPLQEFRWSVYSSRYKSLNESVYSSRYKSLYDLCIRAVTRVYMICVLEPLQEFRWSVYLSRYKSLDDLCIWAVTRV